jgi:small nuclear ribonucleoprotein G
MPQAQPELKKVCSFMKPLTFLSQQILQYMEKRLFVQLNGNRKVIGILRGYDVCTVDLPNLCKAQVSLTKGKVFLNVVLDEAVEEKAGGERVRLGMVVCF